MNLKILLPSKVFAATTKVSRIVIETLEGSFGFLPQRLDCVAALTPGILTYESEAEGEVFVAVDEGVVVKTGDDVTVSVRRALSGNNLAELKTHIQTEFLALNEDEVNMRATMAKLEVGFLHQFAMFQNE